MFNFHSIKNSLIVLPIPLSLYLAICGNAAAVEVRFNAFGDVTAGTNAGDPASKRDENLWKEHGTAPAPLNSNEGFGVNSVDMVLTVDLNDDLVFQSEFNIQTSRGGSSEIEMDVERLYLDYALHPKFNVQWGLFFTPIGYQNRNLYSRAWLMNSVQVHDFIEEELNLVPTHSTGILFHGDLFSALSGVFNYAMSVGNGRGRTPDEAIYARDETESKEVTWRVEYRIPTIKNFRIGISGWSDQIKTDMVGPEYGDQTLVDAEGNPKELNMKETGFNPYLAIDTKNIGFTAELAESTIEEKSDARHKLMDNGWSKNKFKYRSFTSELVGHAFDNKVHPYVRYDLSRLDDEAGGPYQTLRGDDQGLTHKYVPDFNAVIAGIAYDFRTFNRLKFEYIRHLEGPRKKYGVVIQSAFAF